MLVKPSQHDKYRRELEAIENELRDNALKNRADVKFLLKRVNQTYNEAIYHSEITRLRLILETHHTTSRRKPDPYRPYGPIQLLSQGDLHLMDQMDEVPLYIDSNTLTTGAIILGPQGSGKSKAITHITNEFSRVRPDVTITIIDPKNGFRNLPNFRPIDLSNSSFDLKAPPNVDPKNFIFEFMPPLADTCGLIYGLAFLNQAIDIAYSQIQHYIQQTNEETALCLRDIYEVLCNIKVKNFRQVGYLDAAKTASSLIIGKQNLFSCRKGLALEELFSTNTVINARSLTHEMQSKAFCLYLLFWLYQRAKTLPDTNTLKHIIIIDDATMFIGTSHQSYGQKKTSSLGHILAVLRSSGVCCIFASQLPAQIDPAVLSLCRNMIVVGNINGDEHLRVIKSFMSLSEDQKTALPRFKSREALAFISGSPWPRPVHGWTPYVEDVPMQNIPADGFLCAIQPWHALTDIPRTEEPEPAAEEEQTAPVALNGACDRLVFDCITYPFNKASAHAQRMSSIREYDAAKIEALQKGYLLPSQSGKTLYLIPTKKAYQQFSQPCPYQRSTSIEHSYYVLLAAHILKKSAVFTKVQPETPIGSQGATIDVTATDSSGNMIAMEVTLSTSNLLSNASKLQETAYGQIIWLCKDNATATAVKSYFNKRSTLPKELSAKFEYIHFSKFAKQYKERR
jgi:Helicase HerA, central domain